MSEIQQGRNPKVFSIQVSGIRCTNCAGKIKKALTEGLSEADVKICVNIMQEKVSLTLFKDQTVY
jgi:copper chaperone CopZ